MLIKKQAEMDLKNEGLFLISDNQHIGGSNRRTSTPILERKSLCYTGDNPQYKHFCASLERPSRRNLVLNKGVRMSVPSESIISGHLLTEEDLDIFNQSISEKYIKQTLSTRISSLLNDSYRKLIKKSSKVFKKKKNYDSMTSNPESGSGSSNFVDLKNIKNSKISCNANIIIV